MRRLRWFSRIAASCVLAMAALPGTAQQAASLASPQSARPPQAAQQGVQETVQAAEKQAVQQAVQQAERVAAQQGLIGTVSLEDATVTGATSTANGRATLQGNGTVVAKDHVAYVELARGGNVRVCATSGLHLTAGSPTAGDLAAQTPPAADPVATPHPASIALAAAGPATPLMLSLDRGALEVRMNATTSDLLMTPDIRIGFSEPGALDLQVRVTRNGDTCVENRVAGLGQHPTLEVASLFGDETYHVMPGQHVLFERGSLREVVDNESSPCGCPEVAAVHIVEAGDLSLKKAEKVSSTQAEAQHPFPAAVSQGLAPPPDVPQAPAGTLHTQMATTLSAPSAEPVAERKNEAVQPPVPPPATPPASVPAPAKKGGFFHAIGRFFKKVF